MRRSPGGRHAGIAQDVLGAGLHGGLDENIRPVAWPEIELFARGHAAERQAIHGDFVHLQARRGGGDGALLADELRLDGLAEAGVHQAPALKGARAHADDGQADAIDGDEAPQMVPGLRAKAAVRVRGLDHPDREVRGGRNFGADVFALVVDVGDLLQDEHALRGGGDLRHGIQAAFNDEGASHAAPDLGGGGAVQVSMVPEGAAGVIGRHVELVVLGGAGRDLQQDVVAIAGGRDVEAVGVEIGKIKAMKGIHRVRLVSFRSELVAQVDDDLITRAAAKRGADELAIVSPEEDGIRADLPLGLDYGEGGLQPAVGGVEFGWVHKRDRLVYVQGPQLRLRKDLRLQGEGPFGRAGLSALAAGREVAPRLLQTLTSLQGGAQTSGLVLRSRAGHDFLGWGDQGEERG